jgi:bifunctional non-homologous end joining protein LigD
MARKTKRRGRVFLDYLRNDKTSTAVAAWSPRARAGAPIAVPINWQLLEGKRTLPVYTIKTVTQAMKIADPWRSFDADRQPIPIVE